MANLDNISFYLSFKDVNPNWPLISCSFVYGIIAIFGIIFNLSVIWVTVQTKSFRGTVNYLLALCAFFELLHQSGHFLFVYVAFSGQNLIEYRLASKIISSQYLDLVIIWAWKNITKLRAPKMLIFVNRHSGITPAMFFTGIDQLIVIIFNEMHSKSKIRLYLSSMTICSVLYGCCNCINVFYFAELDGDQLITGTFADFYLHTNSFFNMTFFYIFLATCIIYLFVGIVIKFKSTGLHSSETINHRVFRSLCCIIIVNVGGYLIAVLYGGLIKPSILSPITAFLCDLVARDSPHPPMQNLKFFRRHLSAPTIDEMLPLKILEIAGY